MPMLLVKGVTSLIGLSTEAYAHHKNKSRSLKETTAPVSSGPPPKYDEQCDDVPTKLSSSDLSHQRRNSVGSDVSKLSTCADEDDWTLDEIRAELETESSAGESWTTDQLVEDFTKQHPARLSDSTLTTTNRLHCPVIIPQRRPESKIHGFVRAYAPVLNDCGVDQVTFLDFLDNFTKSIKLLHASNRADCVPLLRQQGAGYFNTVNLAVAASVIAYTAAVASVNVAVHIAALAVHLSIEAGKRLHNTSQINKYLQRMNEELFKPRGLYALIMTYAPSTSSADVPVDMNANILSSVAGRDSGQRSKFRSASGKAHEAELPESAPLIFPSLEATTPAQKKGAFKRAGAFVSDYHDRRAQAQFEYNNPDSALNVEPKKEFSSIFADPNHAIHKGGPLNTLSGGYLYKGAKKMKEKGWGAGVPLKLNIQAGKDGGGVGGHKNPIKRVIGENVLYLMVVNMPSEAELKAAAEWAELAQQSQQHQDVPGDSS
ncbi:MAG: hypothetical protein M1818_006318 [Claussenomyces sp. TS43310]|nr:MAG: hypothetical protein M1818_006318 [Claussenomyces sp. TS43310]